ncbi:MAG: 6-hydroxymethylpterin diphosphokinase MptE-like protein [Candidatus Hydrothermarchaeota archaeon]
MDYAEWEPIYREILKDFGFSEEEDIHAARVLDGLLEGRSPPNLLERLGGLLRGARVNIYGAGPSLERLATIPKGINITADGATSYLMERGAVPEIIVTDLDGRVEDQIRAAEGGSIAVVHAHGDNIHRLKPHVPRFRACIGTTQARPFGRLHNFGGFTDGDRAVIMAEHLGARAAVLHGMDFRGEAGRYSFKGGGERKRRKLLWAERLIKRTAEAGRMEIAFG